MDTNASEEDIKQKEERRKNNSLEQYINKSISSHKSGTSLQQIGNNLAFNQCIFIGFLSNINIKNTILKIFINKHIRNTDHYI